MGSIDKIVAGLFAASILLVILVYYQGFVADTNAVGAASTTILQTATGRDSSGNFVGYPAGTGTTTS